jgi:hypothetical protein
LVDFEEKGLCKEETLKNDHVEENDTEENDAQKVV